MAADHLSRLEDPHHEEPKGDEIDDAFPDESLMSIESNVLWYADFANYLVAGVLPKGWTNQQLSLIHI